MDESNAYTTYDGAANLWGEEDTSGAAEDESEDPAYNDGESDGLIYSPLKASIVPGGPDLALEEVDRPAAGYAFGAATYYMSTEEREAYRLSVNEQGQIVDAEGNLYASGQNAQGQLPGSTGGDIFVMDQGGTFAADAKTLQDQLNQGTAVGPAQGFVVHHSTLAAGQRDEDEDGPRLRAAAAGEIRVDITSEQRWQQDEQGRLVQDEDGNYVPGTPTLEQQVRSISDASGHFEPGEDQTLQFVSSLQDQGVNLDNTKINLVGKPVYDPEGDLRGQAQPIDVYSGEFVAAEGDQLALNQKRSVMDQIAGRATGQETEGDSEIMEELARRRQILDHMAEARAQRIGSGDDDGVDAQAAEQLLTAQDDGSGYTTMSPSSTFDPAQGATGYTTMSPSTASDPAQGSASYTTMQPRSAAEDAALGYVTSLPGDGSDGAEDQGEEQAPAAQGNTAYTTMSPSTANQAQGATGYTTMPRASASGQTQGAGAYTTMPRASTSDPDDAAQ